VSAEPAGALAIVLHTHMPYMEGGGWWPPPEDDPEWPNHHGFGTWPFGEEWLWEVVACSYLPLVELLGRAPLTLSLTPVLCDQLEAPGAVERGVRFLSEIRPESHARDIRTLRAAGEEALVEELERSAREYAAAAQRLGQLGGQGLLQALGRHAAWTSAATHPVLPLLATEAMVALQLETGIASHRRRFGHWSGGLWLPECAYAPWLDPMLVSAGVHAACIELTRHWGPGDPRHLRPLQPEGGPLLWPVDRAVMDLVWSERGYPAGSEYRDYHRHTEHRHHVWRTDGRPYDHARALARARDDAADFVRRVSGRVAGGGVSVCALDTELLGHWWYEGPEWLGAVVEQAARQGLRLVSLEEAATLAEPVSHPPELPVSSWGEGGDLRTWSGPPVGEIAWRTRAAELRVVAAGAEAGERALRELLALQSSDWAFLVSRGLAGEYPAQRVDWHERALDRALAGEDLHPELRHLAPDLGGTLAG
jgi:1,4-alpha-glucan branching enzyme